MKEILIVFKNNFMTFCLFVCLFEGLAGEVGPLGASGPRVGSEFTLSHCFSHRPIRALHLSLYLCNRESEDHLEREVKMGPPACKEPKVVQGHQDQMVQR